MRNNRLRAVVITGAALALPLAMHCLTAHADEAPVTTVRTVAPVRGTIGQPVRAYGVVAAAASNLTTLNLPYTARIEQLRVQLGEAVKRGALLFVVAADPAAVVAAAQAQSAAQLAHDELARVQSLYDQRLATQSQLAAARKAALDARDALAAQRQLGIGSGRVNVVAPHDGVIVQVSAAQGDQVQAGAALAQLSADARGDRARPNVTLGVEPAAAASIHPGDSVTVSGLSSALQNAQVSGRVVMVGASVDAQSQLVNVSANVPFGAGPFIPGTRVKADIATQTGTHWIVPRSAVLSDAHGEYVYQLDARNAAHRVPVKTAVEDGERYGIDGALDGARPVVALGNYELKDGAPVHIEAGAATDTPR